jgi:hypothetical protein
MRELDRVEDEKLGAGLGDYEIDEESKGETRFTLCCLDETENLYVFRGGSPAAPKKTSMIT